MAIQIPNKVLRLKQTTEVAKDMSLPAGQEIEIVQDVVYINGFMLDTRFQDLFYNWIVKNPNLFDDITRTW